MSTKIRTEKETERAMLDSMKGITEALARHGHLSQEDRQRSVERRAVAGALPLTLSTFDPAKVTPTPPLSPAAIKALREREGASQAVLATYLGIATATLGQWERGLRKPDGPALRLLSLIDRHGLEYIG